MTTKKGMASAVLSVCMMSNTQAGYSGESTPWGKVDGIF